MFETPSSAAAAVFGDLKHQLSPNRPWFQKINATTVRSDLMAGLTNAAIVLPQGVAFAIIAGLPPEYGLFTAMIPAVIAALFGSSMVMVSGPTTAISAILFATLSSVTPPGTPIYIEMALATTFLVGLIQLAACLLRFGSLITFVSHSVIVGFTAAAALLIAASQLAPALGVTTERGGGVLERVMNLAPHIGDANLMAVGLALFTLSIAAILPLVRRRLPNYLIALTAGTGLGWLMNAPEQGIAMFEPLSAVTPSLHIPNVSIDALLTMLPGAATIAFVGLLEAISIGRSFALRRGDDYDVNQEIMGQSLSNTIGSLFNCYAGSGSFTRSALNAESGAQTPLSAIFAAGFLLALLLIIAPAAQHIPVPVMAGIILHVAWRLVNFGEIRHIIEGSRSETVILAVTFVTGVVTELEVAIIVGTIASLVAFLQKSAQPHLFPQAPVMYHGHRSFRSAELYDIPQCPQIAVVRIEGPLFFASVEHAERRFNAMVPPNSTAKTVIFNMRGVGNVDLSGADFILKKMQEIRNIGRDFHIITTYRPVLSMLRRTHVLEKLGVTNLHPNKADAIAAAVTQAEGSVCENCSLRLYRECGKKPVQEGIVVEPLSEIANLKQ